MSEKKVFVVMPVVGNPYIVSDREVNLKNTQEIVGGLYSNVESDFVIIHPMFKQEQPRWNAIDLLRKKLKKNQYRMICNDNGRRTECMNMALLYASPIYNDVTNLFGIVAIITKEKYLEGIGLPYKGFLCDEEESDVE